MIQELKIALRDNRTATRSYVLVNPMLAKHMPAEPMLALGYFAQLGKKVAEICIGERVLVIGFAETATAVGAAVAAAIKDAIYVHTTREPMPQDKLVADFKEEHSHAKEQSLYLSLEYSDLSQYDKIVFVEDEITTGTTILNFLKKVDWKGKTVITALVFNGLDEQAFLGYDVVFISLQKTITDVAYYLDYSGFPNPRIGISIDKYEECCRNVADRIVGDIKTEEIKNKDVLVIGTEEFMYPALYLGRELEKIAKSVKTHSTTRSPLLPLSETEYPLKTRNSFTSPYDRERTTYLYNLAKYETVIIVTDAAESDCSEIVRVIQAYGNQRIYIARIRNDE
jgi:orotate phosphoribosyltransferase